jgi:RNA polymerase sigma-70 factor (ECF subfamily)
MQSPNLIDNSSGSVRPFATTRWSIVLAAGDQQSPDSQEALASLCKAYWYPVYAFVRRQGIDADQAQDLAQEFFTRFLEKRYLDVVDPNKGRFRSFLLTCCKHFLSNERDRAAALKRGGAAKIVSMDFADAESRYGQEPAHLLTPDRLFERRWALTLLDQALVRLRREFVDAGKHLLFDELKAYLTGEAGARPYDDVAASLGMSVGAVKVAVHRLRGRYRELLREEIARTLGDKDNIDDEIRDLFAALG